MAVYKYSSFPFYNVFSAFNLQQLLLQKQEGSGSYSNDFYITYLLLEHK